jgi:hypothetical protein
MAFQVDRRNVEWLEHLLKHIWQIDFRFLDWTINTDQKFAERKAMSAWMWIRTKLLSQKTQCQISQYTV